MDRNGFKNRMQQYKEAKGFDPLLKYWEWKQKYDSTPQPDNMPSQPQHDLPAVAPQALDDRAHRWDNEHYVDPINTVFDADRHRSWKEPALKTFGKRVKFTYRDFMKPADVKHMKFLQSIGRLGNTLKGASIFGEVVQNLFPSEEAELIEDLRVKMDKQNKWLTGQGDIPKYDEGTEGVRDNTYVAPIEKEQVFIPATGLTKFMQEFRKRNPRGGNLEIVSPEFDILTLGRSIGNALYKNLPTDMVYRRTTQSEIDDILESGVFRKLPEGKVAGKGKTFTINGKTVTLHKKGGNAHGGKAFSKGEPWRGTTVTGTADETIVGIPGKGTQWKVGHHGDYSDYIPFENIEKGKGLWEPFNERGIIENISPKGMRVFRPFTYGYKEDGLLPITGLNLIGENTDQYAEGGEVEPDPLEILERSRPKIAGIPINDRPLSGTDPIGEAMMWGLGGGAASAALRSIFPTYGATAAWLAFGDNNKDNMLVVPNNPVKNTTPIETGLLNKEVRQYYADDVLPRDILTSETDKLRFLNTDKNFEYDLYPSGYFNGNIAGHYDSYADKIRLNGGYAANKDLLDNVMAHEVNHRYNREFPLDNEHNRILNRAYTVEPDLDTPAARAARKPSEKRATNVNIRHRLQTDLRNTLGHNPTKAEMDEFIDSLSDLELLDRLGSASSYGSAYLMSIEDRTDLVKQPADQYKKARTTALRKALKRIAMNENKNDNNQNYA